MQVTENKAEGLKHEFKILVPAADIEKRVEGKIQELAKTARMPGFRPGKVPPSLLRKKYGPNVLGEVLEQAVNETSRETMNERGLRAAVQPKIEVTSFDEGKDLEFSMAVEVMPEIEIKDFGKLAVERLVAEASDEDIQKSLDRLAQSHKDTAPIKTKRKSKKGDIAVIDFVGKVDGEEFPGGKAEDYQLELGSGSFIPGFEDQLIGATAGSDVAVEVSFPEDYGASELAGKDATFDVKVKELRESAPSTIDDELAKKVGMESLDLLKKTIKEEHEREYQAASRQRLKRVLLDELASQYDFEVPEGMVEIEFETIWNQYQEQLKSGVEEDEESKAKSDDEKKAEFRDMAVRRVRLGLLLGEVGRQNNMQVTQEEVNKALMAEARRYPGQEQMVIEFLQQNPQAMEQITAPLYEDKVVDFILELAKVKDKKVSAEELFKDPDEDAKPAPKKAAAKKKAAPKKKAPAKKASTKKAEG